MNIKLLVNCASLMLPTVSAMAANVAPEDVKALPVGTTFTGQPAGEFNRGQPIKPNPGTVVSLVRTEAGFMYIHANGGRGDAGAQKVQCDKIGRAGGKGNATVGCALAHGQQVRFEWQDINHIKYEYWFSMKDMAGQTRNNPPNAWTTLAKEQKETPVALECSKIDDKLQITVDGQEVFSHGPIRKNQPKLSHTFTAPSGSELKVQLWNGPGSTQLICDLSIGGKAVLSGVTNGDNVHNTVSWERTFTVQ